MSEPIRLLHIEDNEDYRDLIAATLKIEPTLRFSLSSVASLREGIDRRKSEGPFDEVLLDLKLGDSRRRTRPAGSFRGDAELVLAPQDLNTT